MKKIIAAFLSAVILCAALLVSAAAEGAPRIEVKVLNDYVYGESTEVKAELWIYDNPSSRGFQATLTFPEFVSDVKSTYVSTLPGGFHDKGNYLKDSHTMIMLYSTSEVADFSGKIADLTLTVDETMVNYQDPINIKLSEIIVASADDQEIPGVTVTEPEAEEQHDVACSHPASKQIQHEKQEADCTKEGKEAWIECGFCHETVSGGDVIPKTSHTSADGKLYYDETANPGKHWKVCDVCGEMFDIVNHAVPDGAEYQTDLENHWYVCECGAEIEKEAHTKDDKGYCDVCKKIAHEHEYVRKSDDDQHWYECSVCGELQGVREDHKWEDSRIIKDATCYADGEKEVKCSVCEKTKTVAITDRPEHTWSDDWTTDDTDPDHHWKVCTVKECGAKGEVKEHTMSGTWVDSGDGKTHYQECTDCRSKVVKDHAGGEATCTEKAVCADCEAAYGEVDKDNHTGVDKSNMLHDDEHHYYVCDDCGEQVLVENHDLEVLHDAEGHWKHCKTEGCGYESEKEEHTASSELKCDPTGHWKVCTSCGEKMDFDAHTGAVFTPGASATATEDGLLANWYCPGCGKYFLADENGGIGNGPIDYQNLIVSRNSGCNGSHAIVSVPANDSYHLNICSKGCGFVIPVPHTFFGDICSYCGYVRTAIAQPEFTDVTTPVEAASADETAENASGYMGALFALAVAAALSVAAKRTLR